MMKRSGTRVHPAAVVSFLLILSAIFAVMAYRNWHDSSVLEERGRSALARVVDISADKYHRVTVEFTAADGRRVSAVFSREEVQDSDPRVGDEFRVVYDPANPQARVTDPRITGFTRDFHLWLPGGFAAVFLLAALILCLRWLTGRTTSLQLR